MKPKTGMRIEVKAWAGMGFGKDVICISLDKESIRREFVDRIIPCTVSISLPDKKKGRKK